MINFFLRDLQLLISSLRNITYKAMFFFNLYLPKRKIEGERDETRKEKILLNVNCNFKCHKIVFLY
jgi:hypothetical protein